MIINRIYETHKLLSLYLISFLHPVTSFTQKTMKPTAILADIHRDCSRCTAWNKPVVISSDGCSMTSCLRPISLDNPHKTTCGHRHSLASTTRTASCVKTVTGVTGSWQIISCFPTFFTNLNTVNLFKTLILGCTCEILHELQKNSSLRNNDPEWTHVLLVKEKNDIVDYRTAAQTMAVKTEARWWTCVERSRKCWRKSITAGNGEGGEWAASYKPVSLLTHFISLGYFLFGAPCIQKFRILSQNIKLLSFYWSVSLFIYVCP